MAAPEQVEVLHELRKIFDSQDVGGKGYLTQDEWTSACRLFDNNQSPEVASESFRRLDVDGEGKLDYLGVLNSFQDQLRDSGADAVQMLLELIQNPASQRNANIASKGRRKGTRKRKGARRTGAKTPGKASRKSRAAGMRSPKRGVKKGKRVRRKKRAAGDLLDDEPSMSMSLTLPHTDLDLDDAELPTMLPPPREPPEPGPTDELAAASMPSDYRVWGPPSSWKPATLRQWKNAELKCSWLPKLAVYDTAYALQKLNATRLKKAGFKLLKTRKAILKKVKRLRELEAELNPSSPAKASDHVPATVEEELSRDMMELQAHAEAFAEEVVLPELRPPPVPPAGFHHPDDGEPGQARPKRVKRGRLKRGKSVKRAGAKAGARRTARKSGTRGPAKNGKKGARRRKGRAARSGAASTVHSFSQADAGLDAAETPILHPQSIAEVANWTASEVHAWAGGFMKPKSARTFARKVKTGLALLQLNAKSLKRLKLLKTKAGRKKVIDNLEQLKAAGSGGDTGADPADLPADGESVEAPAYVASAVQDQFNISVPNKGPSVEDVLSLSPQSPSPNRSGAGPDATILPPARERALRERDELQRDLRGPVGDARAQAQPLFGSANRSAEAGLPDDPNDEEPPEPEEAEPPPLPKPAGQGREEAAREASQEAQGPAPTGLIQSPELESIFQMLVNMDIEQKGYLERDQWIAVCAKLFESGPEGYMLESFGRLTATTPGKLDYAGLLMNIQDQVNASVDAPEGELNPLDVFTNLVQGETGYEEDMDRLDGYGQGEQLSGEEVFRQLQMFVAELNEDDFKNDAGEWEMDKMYEELQAFHDYGLQQNIENVEAMAAEFLGDHPDDYPYTYESFLGKVSDLMPGYDDAEYRGLWNNLPDSENGTVSHRDVKDMIIEFIQSQEMGDMADMPVDPSQDLDQSSDEGRDPPAHFQGQGSGDAQEGGLLGNYGGYPEPTQSMIDSTEQMQAAEDNAREIMEAMELPVERHEV